MNRTALLAIAFVFLLAALGGMLILATDHAKAPSAASSSATEIGGATSSPAMSFEIADTPAKQELGLGKRANVPDNYGMLFVFPEDGHPGFWMKDMLVSIDMVWMDSTGTIVKIDASVSPATYPAVFQSAVPVRYVLETRAGYAADHGWHIGTKVPLPAPYGS